MRRFSQDEMNQILRLASTGEAQDSVSESRFSLDEILKAGSELGYDPARVHAAAAHVASRKSQKHPMVFEFDTVSDEPLSDSAWEAIVLELRREMKATGAVRDRADGGREWICAQHEQSVAVTSSPASDGWHLSVSYDAKGILAISYVFSFSLFVFFCMNALNSISKRGWGSGDAWLALTVLALEVVAAVIGIQLVKRSVRKKAERLSKRVGELAIERAVNVERSLPVESRVLEVDA